MDDLDCCCTGCCASPVLGSLRLHGLVLVAGTLVSFHSPFHSIGNPSAKYNIYSQHGVWTQSMELRVEKKI